MEDNSKKDVSIVLPVYNEVSHLEAEVTRISKTLDDAEMSYEIIVVDDGSTDGSGELAERLDASDQVRRSGSAETCRKASGVRGKERTL